MEKEKQLENKLLHEINNVVAPKIFNINNGTASRAEKSVVKECLGFRSLILYSVMSLAEIARQWEKSGLKYK